MEWWQLVLFCLIGYLVGAIPFSWLIVRWVKGIDLRTVGSGNLGSTNAMRVLGAKRGIAVQALDIAKGWLPVALPSLILEGGGSWIATFDGPDGPAFAAEIPFPVSEEYAGLAIGICAVLGHMFPVYLKFRGGKGVNTCIGVFLALAPKAVLVVAAVALPLLAITRIVSLSSIVGAVLLPFAVGFFYRDNLALIVVAAMIGVLVVFLHRSNIKRLLARTEPRLGKRISTEEPSEREDERSGSTG